MCSYVLAQFAYRKQARESRGQLMLSLERCLDVDSTRLEPAHFVTGRITKRLGPIVVAYSVLFCFRQM
jgi:hypothetical protein